MARLTTLGVILYYSLVRHAFCFPGLPKKQRFKDISPSFASSEVPSPTCLRAQETLNFQTQCMFETEVQDIDQETAFDFFSKASTRKLFVSAGGKSDAQVLETTDECLKLWETCCEKYGQQKGVGDAEFVSSDAKAQFPGLTLVTTVLILAKRNELTPLPEYTFFLVAEKRKVTGLKPVVWTFRQLTGTSETSDEGFRPSPASSVSTVSLRQQDGGFAVHFNAKLNIEVSFPSTLLKVLPMSKEKMEEQGSASVGKAIARDVQGAIEATNKAMQSLCSKSKL